MIPFGITRFLSTAIVLTLVCVCIAACRNARQTDFQMPELPYSQMRTADLVFRTGTGVYSQMLNMQQDTVHYSHIGLLVDLDSAWYVVHAVPKELDGPNDFERVKLEKLEDFLSKKRCLHASLVHTPVPRSDRIVAKALRYARDSVRFDNNFDLNDTTELYCTEMIWRLFLMEGIDLSEGRRSYRSFPTFMGKGCIAPEDILLYDGNESYFSY
jgi:hypothetical protein